MINPDWKEAAEKWLRDNNWDYQKYGDRRGDRSAYDTLMNYEIKEYLGDAFQAGAEHACEQLKQQISERDHAISNWKQEEESWNEQMKQLRTRLEDAEATLKFIAGGCLVPPDGGSPCFDDAVDTARAYFRKHAGGEK